MDDNTQLLDAFQKQSWTRLRELSLRPNGFDGYREHIWPFLLHADPRLETKEKKEAVPMTAEEKYEESPSGQDPHADERQVALDVDRSFIIYPQVDQVDQKTALQNELNELIVVFLRQHPYMHYFQGYHDIVSVLQLTLPQESRRACVEAMSKHRLRDSMGRGLEPMMGQLRLLRNLLRVVDRGYANVLENNAPLPFFSLSHLLTLFSHEVPTLKQIQQIFDYLLCRDPSASIYLAAQVLLDQRGQVFQAIEDDDEGMLHNMLTAWPVKARDKTASYAENPWKRLSQSSEISESLANSHALNDLYTGITGNRNEDPELAQLSGLLKRTDELRSLYPRTLPELGLQSILGTHSVLNTWSQDPACLLSDDQIQRAVKDLELVVKPDNSMVHDSDENSSHADAGLRIEPSRQQRRISGLIGPRAISASALCILAVAVVAYNIRLGRLTALCTRIGFDPRLGGLYRIFCR